MILKKKNFKNEIGVLPKVDIILTHNKLLENYNEEQAIAVFNSIVLNRLGFSLHKTQVMSALKIAEGSIVEMKTGEGKTLVCILASYLNYLRGKKTYISTANNYLVNRDAELCNTLLSELNIKTSFILGSEKSPVKKRLYKYDIVYVNINNMIFDYMRDGVKKEKLINKFDFIILDEADLTLIDYATSPLFLTDNESAYPIDFYAINNIAKAFNEDDYIINNKNKSIVITDQGYNKIEDIVIRKNWIADKNNLYDEKYTLIVEQIKNAIVAHHIIKINDDYIINSDGISVINHKTGRVDKGSKFENGLQQAIEAYNKLTISKMSDITSSITIKTFLKRFNKISGLTGTIYSDKKEISESYGLKVYSVEQNKENVRYDAHDLFFYNKEVKLNYLIKKIKSVHEVGQPILVGTLNVQDSEIIAKQLTELEIPVKVLNAKNEAQESQIIKNAGRFKSVTIATNMAGRGTDIILGGSPDEFSNMEEWKEEHDRINEIGGLFVIGYERSRQRRIDNQLVGRSGRQGDNGFSVFLVSLEDDILSNFNNKGSKKIFDMLGIKDTAVESGLNSKVVKKNQKQIENASYDYRVSLSRYDEENDDYRVFIEELKQNLKDKDLQPYFFNIFRDYLNYVIENWLSNGIPVKIHFLSKNYEQDVDGLDEFNKDDFIEKVIEDFKDEYNYILSSNYFNDFLRDIYFDKINFLWKRMSQSFKSLKEQAEMMRMVQKIPIDEYSGLLENKFNQLYFEINNQTILKVTNSKHDFNKYVDKKNQKNMLDSYLKDGITYGYSTQVGIGF